MKRRTFLARGGGLVGAAALGSKAAQTLAGGELLPPPARDPARGARLPRSGGRIVVVGAGAFGGWTALHLAEAGVEVVLVDAYGPGSARATSGGDSRGLRFAYGDRAIYTRWAVEAAQRWRVRQEEWGTELMLTTGRISLFPALTEATRTTMSVLEGAGVDHEWIEGAEVGRRWPQVAPAGVGGALWEPDATAIRANLACRVVAANVEAAGGELRVARALPPSDGPAPAAGRLPALGFEGGDSLEADAFVFACGSWLAGLFPDLLGDQISVPRRDVFFFGPPAGDDRFSHPNLPNFSEGSRSVYGFPDLDGFGFKVAPFGGLDPFDPDTDERVPAAHWLRRAREYLALRFPAMADQPLVHSRVCQLENAPGDHFLIDRHPELENVWIAGGGSGHAFKHGPVLGEYIARRVLGQETDPELDALWRVSAPD